jgi:hypothetical protein
MKTDSTLGNKTAMNNRVRSLAGTVGAKSSDSPVISDLVTAQLMQNGDLDPNKMK